MKDLDADTELVDYLRTAADSASVSVATLLRKVFHLNSLTQERGFQEAFRLAGRPDYGAIDEP